MEHDPVIDEPLMLRTGNGMQSSYLTEGAGNPDALVTRAGVSGQCRQDPDCQIWRASLDFFNQRCPSDNPHQLGLMIAHGPAEVIRS
ncbi:hypothetical protein MB46_06640 [Arthrobacter alpinus]|uniref:hypothetical protein n=1 Tax=Arthrobacter alpinus TaxID=656366 RepID=UPI0005C826DE|nr:hypothetical protein [Arthrobacter alpinus]ALV45227.1 hypothetical protein MB46_06640 [Arthrobacter alpinus]